jgi:hypothetical protein
MVVVVAGVNSGNLTVMTSGSPNRRLHRSAGGITLAPLGGLPLQRLARDGCLPAGHTGGSRFADEASGRPAITFVVADEGRHCGASWVSPGERAR